MTKQLMSFRFDDSTVNYLQGVVKNSELSMTDYIESLIEIDRNSTADIEWDKGCVITSDERMIVVSEPYYMTQISLLEAGIGIIAAIPDDLIPLNKCLEFAKAQVRKDENILYGKDEQIFSVDINDARYFADHLGKLFNVDVKAGILG